MKRTALYAALLLAALLVPMERCDVGKLKPVEVVHLYMERDAVILETDTGDMGIGRSVAEAYENLKRTTAGIIFLDTADYLLVEESAKNEVAAMGQWVKPSVRVCFAQRGIDLTAAASYLSTHKPATKLRGFDSDLGAEKLIIRGGKILLQKMKKLEKSA